MDRKALAILLIGIIFGIEGVGMGFFGMLLSEQVSEFIAMAEYESMFFETEADLSELHFFNAIASGIIFYGVIKAVIGIFCIAVGASELLEKKAEKKKK